MITMNSTILSYNKINQVQDQIPLEIPDSYIFEEKKSAQKLIPDLYDLDRLEDENEYIQRNSAPILGSRNKLKNYFLNSVELNKSFPKNYFTNNVAKKVIQPNIYSNYDDIGIESLNVEQDNIENESKKQKEENNNIYENEIHKINDNIISNINLNKNILIKNSKKNEFHLSKSGIYTQNSHRDMNLTYNIDNNNNSNKVNKFGEKSIKSEINTFHFSNLIKKVPKKNIIIVDTSLYKPRKRRSTFFSVNNSINDKSKNSINNYLKFEEESNKEQNSLINLKYNNKSINNNMKNKKNIKEEILKSFRNSNSIFDLSNNSHLEPEKSSQLELKDIMSDKNSNINIEENYNNVIKNNIFNHVPNNITKKNSLNEYNFKIERNSVGRNSRQNSNNLNSRCSGLSSRKYNFDCPKRIIKEELSKDNEDFESNNYLGDLSEKNIEKNPFKPLIKINFKNLKKIMKKDALFNILTFLDDSDLNSLLKSNKFLISLINRAIAKIYFLRIKQSILKFKHIFELLKCSLVYSKIKESFKIDFVLNIRFINPNQIYKNIKSEELSPKCYQLLFFYQCYKPIEPNAKFKTKENTKKVKMYDYYTFDLIPNKDKFPSIYISKESQQLNGNNLDEKLVYIQPILPFKFNDKGIINFEIYSSKNNFVDPSSIKVLLKQFDLKEYLNELNINQYNNLRICEYEDISTHWKLIDNEKNQTPFLELKSKLRARFEPNFLIESISFVNIGFFLYKIKLEAKKPGLLDKNKIGNDFGIDLLIKRRYENIENEIKKNNLIIERRQIFELRVGDKIIIYISLRKYKNKSARKK